MLPVGHLNNECFKKMFLLKPLSSSLGAVLKMFLCKPSCSRPEALAEGSLGTYVPREDMNGLSPRAYFFVALSEARGSLGAYAPREDKKESVSREDRVRGCRPKQSEGSPHGGASLTLDRTKKWARQEGVGDFFETALGLKFGLAIIFFA